MTDDLDQMRQKLEEQQEKMNQLHEAEQVALRRREEAQEEAERFEREAESKMAEAGATRFRPDRNASAAQAIKASATELEEKAQEAREEHERKKEQWQQAKDELEELAGEMVPELAEAMKEALLSLVKAYADLIQGEEPLPQLYADRLQPAQERVESLRGELHRTIRLADASQRQRREVQAYLREAIQDVPPAAKFGFLLSDLLTWSRRSKSPALPVWEEAGVEQIDRSILHADPVQAPADTLATLQKRLPLDVNL